MALDAPKVLGLVCTAFDAAVHPQHVRVVVRLLVGLDARGLLRPVGTARHIAVRPHDVYVVHGGLVVLQSALSLRRMCASLNCGEEVEGSVLG